MAAAAEAKSMILQLLLLLGFATTMAMLARKVKGYDLFGSLADLGGDLLGDSGGDLFAGLGDSGDSLGDLLGGVGDLGKVKDCIEAIGDQEVFDITTDCCDAVGSIGLDTLMGFIPGVTGVMKQGIEKGCNFIGDSL